MAGGQLATRIKLQDHNFSPVVVVVVIALVIVTYEKQRDQQIDPEKLGTTTFELMTHHNEELARHNDHSDDDNYEKRTWSAK